MVGRERVTVHDAATSRRPCPWCPHRRCVVGLAKMAELSAEAPLAKFESDDWCEYSDYQTADVCNGNGEEADVGASSSSSTTKTRAPPSQTPHRVVSNKILDNVKKLDYGAGMADNFGCETIGGSLEDLVNTFDDKITKCFRDLDENVETLAPVQIRSQDDVINECPSVLWPLPLDRRPFAASFDFEKRCTTRPERYLTMSYGRVAAAR